MLHRFTATVKRLRQVSQEYFPTRSAVKHLHCTLANPLASDRGSSPYIKLGSLNAFNRRRLIEDCIAIIDNSVDFDLFADKATLADHFKQADNSGIDRPPLWPTISGKRDSGVSGIVLLPRGAFNILGSPFPATDRESSGA